MPTNYDKYLEKLKRPFFKLCRLRFLNPDNSVAFALDNNPKDERNKTFISDGSLSVNLQNGQRRSVDVTLSNVNNEYDYNVNNLWFGTEIALDEGLILDDGTEFYIQQGIFVIDTPEETVEPNNRTVSLNLVDKWANIDGTLYGNLEGTYEVAVGTNIYTPISALLSEDKGNGRAVDNVNPVFTDYYNSMTQTLPDGNIVQITASPYTLTLNDGTIADVVLGLCEMVNAWVGYDESGALRIDPSQDDITDITKPVLWSFSQNESTLLGMSYSVKNTEVYNDYIVVGEQLDDYTQPKGRAQNLDPKSPTNINIIGRKTLRETASGYSTDQQCIDRAVWKLKRSSVLQRAVNISCSQIMHIKENSLVEIIRTDKTNSPIERHLVQGFSRPLASNGNMTISAISVSDYDIATVVQDSSRVLVLESVEFMTEIPTDTIRASVLSIGGKSIVMNQLLNKSSFISTTTSNGVTFQRNDDGTYTVSGTATADTTFWFKWNLPTVTSSHKYMLCGCPSNGSSSTFYINATYFYGGADTGAGAIGMTSGSVSFSIVVKDGVSMDSVVFCPQFYDLTQMFGSGNEPTTVDQVRAILPNSYYAYNTGSVVSAEVDEVEVVGRNLFDWDSETLESGYVNINSGIISTSENYKHTGYIPFVGYDGKHITITPQVAGINTGIAFYSGDDFLSGIHSYENITVPNGTDGIRFTLGVDDTYCQLEIGSTATEYSPYTHTTITIPSSITSLDGYGWSAGSVYNYVDYAQKKFHKKVARVDLGTFTYARTTSYTNPFFYTNVSLRKTGAMNNGLCELYTVYSSTNSSAFGNNAKNMQMCFSSISGSTQLFVRNDSYTTSESFQTDMSGIYLYYELETEVVIDISDLLDDGFLTNIAVESGGTITYHSDDDYPVPVQVPVKNKFLIHSNGV